MGEIGGGVSAQTHHPYLRPSPGGSLITNTWVSIAYATTFSLITSKCKATNI